MNKLFLLSRAKGMLVSLLLLMAVTLVQPDKAQAQNVNRPQSPILCLTGVDGPSKYETTLYPDGRVWLPPSTSKVREFLLPVFIKNNFFTFDNNYIAPPIYSFKFSLLYDSSAIRAVGVETKHPDYIRQEMGYTEATDVPTADGFNISWDDQKDNQYWRFIDEKTWRENPNQAARGRRVTVNGTSTSPLPHNDKNFTGDWKILLYVKFKVVAQERLNDPNKSYLKTPIYLDNREIRFNDLDVTKQFAYEGMTYYNPDTYRKDYPTIPANAGLEGLRNDNLTNGTDNPVFKLEPILPGVIWLWISDQEPNFTFPSDPSSGFTITNMADGAWQLDQPITVDSNASDLTFGSQVIEVDNSVTSSRLSQIEITSDSPWLLFKTEPLSKTDKSNLKNPVKSGYINYLDNDILGSRRDPRGDETADDGKLFLRVICNPEKLNLSDPTDAEKAGVYTGYLTFSSPYAKTNPVRLKVTFVYIRNPYEPAGTGNPKGYPGGVYLTLRNSRPGAQETKTIVFGTAHRGTTGVDSLMGEFHPASDISGTNFDVRFYPYPEIYPEEAKLYPNGFGDFAPKITEPRSVSRDIRDYNSNKTHIFYCRFNAGAPQNYPVTMEWDTQAFPKDARVYLKYIVNGVIVPGIDMRKGSPIGGTRMSYMFGDQRVNEFLIEYTLPKTINYVDQFNEPIIKTGWNLLSLPVRPTNTEYKEVYKNCINIPYMFTLSQYQEVTSLQPGIGYFVKYGTEVDRQFSGTEIRQLSNELPYYDEIRIYPGTDPKHGGWNCIGSLSVPVNINSINFTQFSSDVLPTKEFTTKAGIYGYRTDKGYYEVSEMLPGLGYWMKANSNGYLKLVSQKTTEYGNDYGKNEIRKNSVEVMVRDNGQHESSVYLTSDSKADISMFELPPTPPAEIYDVRFVSGGSVANGNENVLVLQAAEYPVALTINKADADITVSDAITGAIYGTAKKGSTSSITIQKSSNSIKIEKAPVFETSLSAYPNPAETASTVKYSVANQGMVSIKMFDALGNEVMTIFEGSRNAGEYSESINVGALASGNYLVKMVVDGATTVAKINVVK